MGRIESFKGLLGRLTYGRECFISFVSSQIISNVPSALLLSGFTDNLKGLIIGTNIGGLGTLIASMASLISFKYIAKLGDKNMTFRYVIYFTVWNVIFAALLIGEYLIIVETPIK